VCSRGWSRRARSGRPPPRPACVTIAGGVVKATALRPLPTPPAPFVCLHSYLPVDEFLSCLVRFETLQLSAMAHLAAVSTLLCDGRSGGRGINPPSRRHRRSIRSSESKTGPRARPSSLGPAELSESEDEAGVRSCFRGCGCCCRGTCWVGYCPCRCVELCGRYRMLCVEAYAGGFALHM